MKYPDREDHKAFYESFFDKKMNQKEYEWAIKEDKWLDEVQDKYMDDVLDGMTFKAPKKEEEKVQEWALITRKELLEKHGSGTMWIFKPIYRIGGEGMTFEEMRVTKINISHAGKGFSYNHGSDVMDLGLVHKDSTREMWETFVASGEYVEYNKPQERRRPSAHGKKNSNYALEA